MELALAMLILVAGLMICTGGTLATWLLAGAPPLLVQVRVIAVVPRDDRRAYARWEAA